MVFQESGGEAIRMIQERGVTLYKSYSLLQGNPL